MEVGSKFFGEPGQNETTCILHTAYLTVFS
jgi:hypothetical protein